MDLHGGSISVESRGEGHGSTFTVTLPLIEVNSNDIEGGSLLWSPESCVDLSDVREAAANPSSQSTVMKSNGQSLYEPFKPQPSPAVVASILVVDDSAINRKMLCRLFASKSIPCDQAGDGCVAVAMVQSMLSINSTDWLQTSADPLVGSDNISQRGQYYDVILMDYQMPNMDGPSAIRAIRSLGYKGVIFGVTGNVMTLDKQEMMAAGADDVLSKPFDIDKFWESYSRLSP